MSKVESHEQVVDAVENLARAVSQQVGPHADDVRDRRSWLEIQRKLHAPPPAPRRLPRIVGAAACAAAAIAVVALFVRRPERALTYQVAGGMQSSAGDVIARETTPAAVEFSDGSVVTFSARARGRVAALSATGGLVELSRGRASVSVAKRPRSDWVFSAGPYTIWVMGTRFSLDWDPDAQELRVDLSDGSVTVTGPSLAKQGVAMTAGQTQVFRPQPPSAKPDPEAPARSARTERAGPIVDAARSPVGRAPGRAAHDWASQFAAGRYDEVVRDAERRGIGAFLRSAAAADLHILADSARYAGKPRLARDALLSVRRRYAGTSQAAEAAFFLGRLSHDGLSDRTDAETWYARYVSEAPSGRYLEHAIGRRLELRAGSPDAATAALARSYLARFPNGAYARLAQRLAGGG